MDQSFVPTKASKLVVRVKINTNLPIDFSEKKPKIECSSTAIFFIVLILSLIISGGYYYTLNPEKYNSASELVRVSNAIETPPVKLITIDSTNEVVIKEVSVEKSVVSLVPISFSLEKKAPASSELGVHVTRAQFAYGIKDREPFDLITGFSVPVKKEGVKKVYFFTELKNLKGQVIKHSWFHDGVLASEIKFNVRGNRWRVYSSKQLNFFMQGEWQTKVTNEQDKVLSSSMFNYE